MTEFLLIRHATHAWVSLGLAGRRRGIHLSEQGIEEAEALARLLRDLPISAIYSSPLDRTRETAAPLARELGLDVVYDAAFLEIDYGVWTGRTFQELEHDPAWRHWNHSRSSAQVPGGESMRAVQVRAVDQLTQLARRHCHELVVIVSHGDLIRALLLHCLGMSLDQIHHLQVEPASIHPITWEGQQGEIVTRQSPGAPLAFPLSRSDEKAA